MTLKDRLKGREKHKEAPVEPANLDTSAGTFTFLRTTTNFQETIQPPLYAGDTVPGGGEPETPQQHHESPRRLSRFRSASNASKTSTKSEKRLTSILHIRSHSRESTAGTSVNVPPDLPEIHARDSSSAAEDQEARWEERATILAQQVAATRSRSNTRADLKLTVAPSGQESLDGDGIRPGMARNLSDAQSDVIASPTHEMGGPGLIVSFRRIFKKRSGYTRREVRSSLQQA